MKPKILSIVLLVACHFSAKAQVSIPRQVVASSGAISTAGGLTISSTIGQVANFYGTSASVVLTQGFQQVELTPANITSLNKLNGISIFPNPTSQFFTIENKSNLEMTNLQFCDMLGKSVLNLSSNQKPIQNIDVSSIANGVYLLKMAYVENSVSKIATYKIQIIK